MNEECFGDAGEGRRVRVDARGNPLLDTPSSPRERSEGCWKPNGNGLARTVLFMPPRGGDNRMKRAMHHQPPMHDHFLETPANDTDPSPLRWPPISGARILLVEDDPSFSELVAWSLEDHGYVVATAEGITEARCACEDVDPEASFDLIVSDVIVPRGSGTELLVAPQIVSRKTPVILMTACPSPELRAFVDGCGGELLEKPFPIETLLARVLDRLRGRFVSILSPARARLRGAS